jgi:hypothetical protein
VRVWKAVCCGFVLAAALLAEPGIAWASCDSSQPTYVCITSNTRSPNGLPLRLAQFNPGGINYSDCAKDVTLDFALTVEGAASGDDLQIWVGPPTKAHDEACLNPAARKTGGSCWPLAPFKSIAIGSSVNVSVRAQDIAANLDNSSPPSSYTKATSVVEACQKGQTSPGPISLGIYFMLVGSDGKVDGDPAEFALQADVLGPFAPATVSATINDGYAQLSWVPPTDPSIAGYNVYCEDFGKDAAEKIGEKRDTGINGLDGGTTTGTCQSSLFANSSVFTTSATSSSGDSGSTATPDSGTTDTGAVAINEAGLPITPVVTPAGISEIPLRPCASPSDGLEGGTSGATASSATVTVTNYDYWVFAVAAIDTSGNVGPIGNLTCGVPGPLADFWYDYTNAGGLAGGGYCALEAVGSPGGSVVMALGVGFVGIGFVRRRRGRSASRRAKR